MLLYDVFLPTNYNNELSLDYFGHLIYTIIYLPATPCLAPYTYYNTRLSLYSFSLFMFYSNENIESIHVLVTSALNCFLHLLQLRKDPSVIKGVDSL